jgi:hypothetical protein
VEVTSGQSASFTNERNTVNWLGDSAIVANIFRKKGGGPHEKA